MKWIYKKQTLQAIEIIVERARWWRLIDKACVYVPCRQDRDWCEGVVEDDDLENRKHKTDKSGFPWHAA